MTADVEARRGSSSSRSSSRSSRSSRSGKRGNNHRSDKNRSSNDSNQKSHDLHGTVVRAVHNDQFCSFCTLTAGSAKLQPGQQKRKACSLLWEAAVATATGTAKPQASFLSPISNIPSISDRFHTLVSLKS